MRRHSKCLHPCEILRCSAAWFSPLQEFVMRAAHRNELEPTCPKSPDNITAIAQQLSILSARQQFIPWGGILPLRSPSRPLHEAVDNALLARPVEMDGELVAVNGGDIAVAEFLMKHALADDVVGDGAGGLGDQLAFDGGRRAWIASEAG